MVLAVVASVSVHPLVTGCLAEPVVVYVDVMSVKSVVTHVVIGGVFDTEDDSEFGYVMVARTALF